jgi:hypothetical protein
MSSMGSVAAAIYSCTTAKPNRRFQAKRAHIRAARGVRQELCQALALEGGVHPHEKPGISRRFALSHSELRAMRLVFFRLRVE